MVVIMKMPYMLRTLKEGRPYQKVFAAAGLIAFFLSLISMIISLVLLRQGVPPELRLLMEIGLVALFFSGGVVYLKNGLLSALLYFFLAAMHVVIIII